MKEIVFISGKGGTGKTSITAAMSYLLGGNCILADCDVDAADMHLVTRPQAILSEIFFSGVEAKINTSLCSSCARCFQICRFHAINAGGTGFSVDPLSCEGCGYCFHICPEQAISLPERKVGIFQISQTRFDNILVHAELDIGAENSGKLVTKVKKEARKLAEKEKINIILVDGSPGIGCPVISSLAGAGYVVMVTEPSRSAFHDLQRVHILLSKFGLPAGCIINKCDLNEKISSEIKDFLVSREIALLAEIPFSRSFSDAMIAGKTIMETDAENIILKINNSWDIILKQISGEDT
ncbi:MAG: ATP-binding protein [Candidatus Cloacimonetes bacterium]|nr:ATP-binding protein [Candidatus Cloacimonadota bacterium]